MKSIGEKEDNLVEEAEASSVGLHCRASFDYSLIAKINTIQLSQLFTAILFGKFAFIMVPEISPHLIGNFEKCRVTFVTLVQVLSMHYKIF